MDTNEIIIAVLVVLLIIAVAAIAWFYFQRQKSERLRRKFGKEYDRALGTSPDRSRAEEELQRREKRVQALDIHPLTHDQYESFAAQWENTQTEFVNEPSAAVKRADDLIKQVMQARGFPMQDFEHRVADISAVYPDVVPHYREAHAVAVRNEKNEASTEDLRQAFVHYRSLFNELLQADVSRQKVRTG